MRWRRWLAPCFVLFPWRIACRPCGFPAQVAAFLVIPGGLIVRLCCRVEARIEPVLRQLESFFDDKRGVGVVEQVVFCDAMVLDGVLNQAAKERNVRTRANLAEQIGNRSCAR